jgi:protein-tyrosine phosphatase
LITKVWEHLHVGGLKDAERLNADNPASITAVVSLCPDEVLPKAKGIKHVEIAIPDAQPISAEKFEKIMKTLTEQVSRGTVLLVCAAGMSRSPIMAAAWMHSNGHLNFDRHAAHRRTSAND